MAKRIEDPTDYKGPRTVVRSKSTTCGWCLSNDCEHCKPELVWYEKLYVCGCKCKDDYVPVNTGGTIEPETKKKRGKDDLRDVQLRSEAGQPENAEDSSGKLRQLSEPEETTDGSLEEQPADGNNEPTGRGEDNPTGSEDS